MNELHLHKEFLKQSLQNKNKKLSQNNPTKNSIFTQIAKRIIAKQKGSKSTLIENVNCKQCNRTIASERNIETGKWYYPDFDINTYLCKQCTELNLIAVNPAKYLQLAGVPIKYTECSFNNFKVIDAMRHNISICIDYINQKEFHKGLYLYGSVGTGKTHIAVAVLREMLILGQKGIFISVPTLLLTIRRAFQANNTTRKTEEYYLKEYSECQLLVLDDFGMEKTTEWNRQIIDYIVYERDNNLRPLIVTSNLSVNEIAKKVDIRIASRLSSMNQILHFTGPDYRNTRKQ